MGESHAIYNHTDRDTRWFNFHVIGAGDTPRGFELNDDRAGAPLESVERLPIGRLDRDVLELSRLHGGAGRVGRREVWGPRDFRTTFGRVVHCLLPPGASIGYHRHEILEECYVIMHGSGRMTVDGETAEVSAGDAIPNALGGSHGLYNHTKDDLELFLVAVCVEKGKFDAIELNDDLTKR
jgi:mannose-6-phosphate isomerase-like protein (cupin superfamily)